MPGAYSTDLRERVLVAVEAGEPAEAVAEEFMIGRSSVYRWMAAARDEGRHMPKPMGRGRARAGSDRQFGWSIFCSKACKQRFRNLKYRHTSYSPDPPNNRPYHGRCG
jgi:transposase